MKLLYVGTSDFLAKSVIEKFRKEDFDITVISDSKFSERKELTLKHQFYQYSTNLFRIETIFSSVKPDVVVFAGLHYLKEDWIDENDEYLTVLQSVLFLSHKYSAKKFIYLSSYSVFGTITKPVFDDSLVSPERKKDIIMSQGEYLIDLFRKKYGMHISTIRSSQIFTSLCDEADEDFLSTIFRTINKNEEFKMPLNQMLQPIYVGDFTEALKRVVDFGSSKTYNVASSSSISYRELKELIEKKIEGTKIEVDNNHPQLIENNNIQCKLIKEELEWVDLYSLKQMLVENKIKFVKQKVKEKKPKSKIAVPIRQTFENFAIFLVFFGLYFVCKEHPLFSQIPWLLIYIVLISLFYGVRNSLLSILLASAAYLSLEDLSLFEMSNFYSYAGATLVIVSFVFFGIMISYHMDSIREKLREIKREHDMIEVELTELKAINQENSLIKEEYEKRLLESKSGITKLYETFHHLLVMQPDRIFMELMKVIKELLETDTVSVYKTSDNSSYLRLVNALNNESVIEGKSWNLDNYPKISKAIREHEIFQGNIWENEPAYIIPIERNNKTLVIIVIKTVHFEKQSLYYLNMLRTIRMLVRDIVEKAMDYQDVRKEERIDKSTGALKWSAFKELIEIAKEKEVENLAEYSILRIENPKDSLKIDKLFTLLRMTDYLGVGPDDKVYTLLTNSSKNDSSNVISRMKENGVEANVVDNLGGA